MAGLGPKSSGDVEAISEINVTPFVDVVLVLLVIFMVTAPALMKDTIGIKLPKASKSDNKTVDTLGVAINKQGQVLINGVASTEEAVKEAVRVALSKNSEVQALITADQDSRHGDVVKAIDWIKQGGLDRFAVQIERESTQSQ